jgi:integrase
MPDNEAYLLSASSRTPWNKGKLIGAKPPLRPKHVWAIRTRLMIKGQSRDLAMFNLAIDSSYAVATWWPSKLRTLRLTAHSLRRTKATLIYRRNGNLRAVQLLLGHTKIESTVRYRALRSMTRSR